MPLKNSINLTKECVVGTINGKIWSTYPPRHLNLTGSPCATNSEFSLEESLFSERRCLSLRIILQTSPRHVLKCCLVVALSRTTYWPTLPPAHSLAHRLTSHGLARSDLRTALWAAWLISNQPTPSIKSQGPGLRYASGLWWDAAENDQLQKYEWFPPSLKHPTWRLPLAHNPFRLVTTLGKRRFITRISETISFFPIRVKFHSSRKFEQNNHQLTKHVVEARFYDLRQ